MIFFLAFIFDVNSSALIFLVKLTKLIIILQSLPKFSNSFRLTLFFPFFIFFIFYKFSNFIMMVLALLKYYHFDQILVLHYSKIVSFIYL